jgi:signal transduction histidine kinase
VAVLTGVLAVALVWITLLRRKVEERTAQLQKQIEERQIVEQRRVMEQERTRVAQDLHDELGAGLTEMGLLGDLVKNPAVPMPEKHQYLGQMTDTARSLVASLDEIVWAVNPRYDSVASLASYYTLFAQRFLDLAGVACRPHMPASFPEYPLDSKGRHGLFLAFKEALNNVVRHSGATEVSLKIEVGQGELIISVTDNGHGFNSATEAAGGEGLQGMRHRLEHLGGGCEIRSRPGLGTEVELRLPVGNHTL